MVAARPCPRGRSEAVPMEGARPCPRGGSEARSLWNIFRSKEPEASIAFPVLPLRPRGRSAWWERGLGVALEYLQVERAGSEYCFCCPSLASSWWERVVGARPGSCFGISSGRKSRRKRVLLLLSFLCVLVVGARPGSEWWKCGAWLQIERAGSECCFCCPSHEVGARGGIEWWKCGAWQ
jgi:hypothetical protein